MSVDVLATMLTGVGVLLGVWRMMESFQRDLTAEFRTEIRAVHARIDAVNARIDTVLIADRSAAR